MSQQPTDHTRASIKVYRHSLSVRLTHWAGALCLLVLLMSGLQIFNAHPALYWGNASDFPHPIAAIAATSRGGRPEGVTEVLGHAFDTTGVLGVSGLRNGQERGFPAWITLPGYQDLATGRRWHFFFAWLLVLDGLIYFAFGFAGGHIRRDLIPSRRELREIGGTILDHLRLRFARGKAAQPYNVLQQLSYLVVLFVVVPLLILAGLALAPGIDAALPALTSIFGGRQSARTVHFVCAFLLVAFVTVHVLVVILSGAWNRMRSMITGWYAVEPE